MKPKLLNPVPATAVALGVLIVGLAAYSPSRAGILDLLQHKSQPAGRTDAPAPAEPVLNTAPVLGPIQAPNYRAIVRQWGPAAVGITVEGTRKTGLEGSPGFEGGEDPVFHFLRDLPRTPFHEPHYSR